MNRSPLPSALVAGLALLASAGAASAEGTLSTTRSFNIDLSYARYTPNVDSEFKSTSACEGKKPYEYIFGDENHGLLRLAYQQHLFDRFGTLTGGGAVGYFSARSGEVRPNPCAPGNAAVAVSGETSDAPEQSRKAKTEFTIIPLQAELSYRLDKFEDYVPLVPVVRAGLDYDLWTIYGTNASSDQKTATFEKSQPADGGTWGWHYTLGVHLLLDYFAQEMAADFDRDAGVNSTYLTLEFSQISVDDFGSKTSIRLGDTTFQFGLSFDI